VLTVLRGYFAGDQFIDVTPDPVVSWLDRTHHGMGALVKMLGGMLVLRRIAAADSAAHHAHPQMNPGVADFYAFFTDMLVGGGDFDLIQMLAFLCHV
jgi:hypothetical protein